MDDFITHLFAKSAGRPSPELRANIARAEQVLFERMRVLLENDRRVWKRSEVAAAIGISSTALALVLIRTGRRGDRPSWLAAPVGGRGWYFNDGTTPHVLKVTRRKKEPKPDREVDLTEILKASMVGTLIAMQVRGHARTARAVGTSDMENFIEEAQAIWEIFTETMEAMA